MIIGHKAIQAQILTDLVSELNFTLIPQVATLTNVSYILRRIYSDIIKIYFKSRLLQAKIVMHDYRLLQSFSPGLNQSLRCRIPFKLWN